MKRSDIQPLPEYFDRYINLADDIELPDVLQKSLDDLDELPLDKLNALGDKIYAPGKWTVKDMIQHITDTERIFSYRALRFARNDSTKLPGFEEDDFAREANATQRSLTDLLDELKMVRRSSIAMFASFSDEILQRTGPTFKKDISVLGIGFTTAGHQVHHFNILKERYYPLLG
jgi:DinB superfamily